MSSLVNIGRLAKSAEEALRNVKQVISKIDGSHRYVDMMDIDLDTPEMSALVAAIASAAQSPFLPRGGAALPRVSIGALATALAPVAAALVAFGKELSGPAGRTAAAAACRNDECRLLLGQVASYYGGSFIEYNKILRALDLFNSRPGDVPSGAVSSIFAPIPLCVDVFPVMVKALGGMEPAELARPSLRASYYATMVGTAGLFLELTHDASAVALDSSVAHPSYQRELAALRTGSLSATMFHVTALPAATELVLKVAAVDAALAAAAPHPDVQASRRSLNAAEICGSFLFLVCEGVNLVPTTLRGGVNPDGSMAPGELSGRLGRCLAVPDFVLAFLTAIEQCSVSQDSSALFRCALGASTFPVFFTQLGMISALDRWPPEALISADILSSRETQDRLVAVSAALLKAATATGAGIEESDRADVMSAAFILPMFALYLAVATCKPEPASARLDLKFAVGALGASATAWNARWETMQPSEARTLSGMCQICGFASLIFLKVIRIVPHTMRADSADVEGAVAAIEGLACMSGSLFVTLQAHMAQRHVNCMALQLAALMPCIIAWTADTLKFMCGDCDDDQKIPSPEFTAPAMVQAGHASLAAARAYAAADAPWAAWVAAAAGTLRHGPYSNDFVKFIPSLHLNAVSTLAFLLTRVLADTADAGLSDASLAGLVLDIFATVDALVVANPDALSSDEIDFPDDYEDAVYGVDLALGSLATLAAIVDVRVGLGRYLTGPEAGAKAMVQWAVRGGDEFYTASLLVPDAPQRLRRLASGDGQGSSDAGEGAHKMRAHALATLPCACLGCTRTRRPGEQAQPSKRCSGCVLCRFCSTSCHKKAWSSGHKIACRAIAAEK